MNITFENIGKKINSLMAKEGISGMELARKVGIPPSTIKKIRSQEITNPTIATLIPIAKYFSVTLDDLLDNTNEIEKVSGQIKKHYTLPIIKWEDALKFPTLISKEHQTVIIDYDYGMQSYALLSKEEEDNSIFQLDSLLIVDQTAPIQHLDFLISLAPGETKSSIRQFVIQNSKPYLRSFNRSNDVMSPANEFQLLGVIMEYRRNINNFIK